MTTRVGLLELEQPFANHNGGGHRRSAPTATSTSASATVAAANDPLGAGQDPVHLARVDPAHRADSRRRETVPTPFPPTTRSPRGSTGLPEIFLTGARNPWRFSFDCPDRRPLGGRRGPEPDRGDRPPPREPTACGLRRQPRMEPAGGHRPSSRVPAPQGNVDPVFEYRHSGGTTIGGCSVSGRSGCTAGHAPPRRSWAPTCSATTARRSTLGPVDRGRRGDVPLTSTRRCPWGNLVGFGVDPDGELAHTLAQRPEVKRGSCRR